MRFYVGDKVRMLDGCKILLDDPHHVLDSACAGNGVIFTVDGIKKYSNDRIGIHLKGAAKNCDYDKRGLELVERGPNAPKRKKKAKAEKPTPKFKVGDKVRTKPGLVVGKEYWELKYLSGMEAEGIIVCADSDRTYKLNDKPFWYSEEMLELAPETTEKPKEGKTLERGELVKTFMKLTETDKHLKRLTDKMPIIVTTFVFVLSQIENELLGEE